MFSVLLICMLTIMNAASKKNMMSISGMMTIRERRLGMGEKIFIAKINQWAVAWLGDVGWCKWTVSPPFPPPTITSTFVAAVSKSNCNCVTLAEK